jgi:hypothetical protein
LRGRQKGCVRSKRKKEIKVQETEFNRRIHLPHLKSFFFFSPEYFVRL